MINELNERMKTDEEILFKNEPRLNVISKETYENRVSKVFKLLWSTLAKSFGPYGAPTLIYNYPYSHVTKDGFTIMKNISMDASEQLVDQAIANMASDICGRLNYSVGDGTTSAVIATNSIYQNYLKHKEELQKEFIMPRDIIQIYNNIKNRIIKNLHKYVKSINSNDPEELYENIYKIVFISSNGDPVISSYIADMYKELQFPGITCELAPDGITKKRIISGYQFELVLNDKLYINSDDNTMSISNADIIFFSVKITKDIYEKILKPLNEQSRLRGRKLIVCASSYDETALGQTIRRDLLGEYKQLKEINMVLCTYKALSDHTRKLASDFAMLCNTLIIDRTLLASIYEEVENHTPITTIFNIDNRTDIPNLICMGVRNENAVRFINGKESDDIERLPLSPNAIRLGYVGNGSIGLKKSLFTDFYYDENMYNKTLKDAEDILKETEEKYKKLGTFNLVVNQAFQRYYALKLKMGIIEVGGDSELSQKLLKDAVDDAIKAASSAFDNGIVNGCNVDMMRAIRDTMNECENADELDERSKSIYLTLLNILNDGFRDVYKTVLSNAFDNVDIVHLREFNEFFGKPILTLNEDDEPDIESYDYWMYTSQPIPIHDVIVSHSISEGKVFDVSTREFVTTVINSSKTDEEILVATIDLIGLLISGNQMVITQKHNFE